MDFSALATRNGFYRLHRFIRALHHSTGLREKDAARFCKPHGFSAVVEKCNAKFIFEIPNLSTQRRLRDVQARGGARHVLFFSDGDEVSQVTEFHLVVRLAFWIGEPSGKNSGSRRSEGSWKSRMNMKIQHQESDSNRLEVFIRIQELVPTSRLPSFDPTFKERDEN